MAVTFPLPAPIRHPRRLSSRPFSVASAVAAALVAAGCASRVAPETVTVTRGTVLQNVTIVDTGSGALQPRMNVVVDAGRIVQITTGRPIAVSGAAQSIDASGKYLVPGYLDMHTHALGSPERQQANLSLLLANGVTGIREMAGSAELIQRARQLNVDVAAGRADAPEILAMPGDLIIGANDPAAATIEVRRQKAIGADFIKLITANRAASLAILAEAKAQNLPVAGHLSVTLPAIDSSNAGWRSVEHLGSGMGMLLDCSANEGAIRQSILNGEGAKPPPFSPAYVNSPMLFRGGDVPIYARILDSYSEQKCGALARAFVRNQTWSVPTLHRLRAIEISDEPRFRSDPNLEYLDRQTVALWQSLGQRYATEYSRPAANTLRQYYIQQQKLVKLMKDVGVKMLAGSDSGGSGIWMVPGFSLHQEFGELVAAGLTPLDVLQMTTRNGAEYLGRESTMGSVAEGKNADLVLLNGNPVESVVNLNRIAGVMLKGRWLPAEALERMKADVARAAAARVVGTAAPEEASHVH